VALLLFPAEADASLSSRATIQLGNAPLLIQMMYASIVCDFPNFHFASLKDESLLQKSNIPGISNAAIFQLLGKLFHATIFAIDIH
jgi:hypothetical protein